MSHSPTSLSPPSSLSFPPAHSIKLCGSASRLDGSKLSGRETENTLFGQPRQRFRVSFIILGLGNTLAARHTSHVRRHRLQRRLEGKHFTLSDLPRPNRWNDRHEHVSLYYTKEEILFVHIWVFLCIIFFHVSCVTPRSCVGNMLLLFFFLRAQSLRTIIDARVGVLRVCHMYFNY